MSSHTTKETVLSDPETPGKELTDTAKARVCICLGKSSSALNEM